MKNLHKKIAIIALDIVFIVALNSSLIPSQTSYAILTECETTADCPSGQVCDTNTCMDPLDVLLPLPGEESENGPEELEVVANLPNVSLEEAIANTITTILGATMILTLIAIIAAGAYFLTAEGDEEKVTKAKRIIIYLVIGMSIMAAAYGIVAGIAQFEFFE